MFCSKCGKEMPEGTRFCTVCGTKLAAIGDEQTKPASAVNDAADAETKLAVAQSKVPVPELVKSQYEAPVVLQPKLYYGKLIETDWAAIKMGLVVIIISLLGIVVLSGKLFDRDGYDETAGSAAGAVENSIVEKSNGQKTENGSFSDKQKTDDKDDVYNDAQELLSQEYDEMFGGDESSFTEESNFGEYEDNYQEDADYADDEYGNTYGDNYQEDVGYADDEYGNTYGDFVLPNSDSEYLAWSELENLSAEECRIARNEIYARHGRKFDDEQLQEYFESCSWYEGSIDPEDFSDEVLSEIERANLQLIVEYEKKMGY